MESKQLIKLNTFINVSTVAGFILSVIFIMYGVQRGLFTSQADLDTFLKSFGLLAPLIFMALQIIQVIIPIIPGGISCVGGIIIFGPVHGFIYNYISICIGSIIAFILARHHGITFVQRMSSKSNYSKYLHWLHKPNFEKLFAISIFMPVAPDDFLCYLAGLSNINFKRFIIIILLGKPFGIAAYTFGLNLIIQYFLSLL